MDPIFLAFFDFNLSSITPTVVFLILGATLLALGITGGNVEIKGIRIPPITGAWRILSLVTGIVFLAFIGLAPLIKRNPAMLGSVSDPKLGSVSVPKQVSSPNTDTNNAQMDLHKPKTPTKPRVPAAQLPSPTGCDIDFSALKMRADSEDSQYTWGSYNRDLKALELAAETLIEHLRDTRPVNIGRTRICFDDLGKYAQKIHDGFCNRFQGAGPDGKPRDNDRDDHCFKNFDQFSENEDYKIQNLDLSEDLDGFGVWFSESVVNYVNPQGQKVPIPY
jgi:hypothetical protein